MYDLVAQDPIKILGTTATLTARTSDGHDVTVNIDWTTLRDAATDDATAYLSGIDMPDLDVTDPVHVTVNGVRVQAGPITWANLHTTTPARHQ